MYNAIETMGSMIWKWEEGTDVSPKVGNFVFSCGAGEGCAPSDTYNEAWNNEDLDSFEMFSSLDE